MPIYEYKCAKCDAHLEKLLSYEESEKPLKCDCSGTLEKVKISKSNFHLKGNWYKNNKSY